MGRTRRQFVGCVGAGLFLAGCIGNSDIAGDTEPGDEASPGATAERTQLETHPAAATLDRQPYQGPAPTDADGVIIEFADPSCPGCGRFEQNTYPTVKSNLVDTEKVAFVYREFPIVAPWGESASQALEGTFEQRNDTFWQLKSYYYANSDAFTEDNVLEKTETYLQQETDIEADVVINGVSNDEFAAAVDDDVTAGDEAGVRGTPSFYLFRQGSFMTKIEGPQDYAVFENALGY